MRYAPGDEPLPPISPPVELPKPLFGDFDDENAGVAHAALSAGDAATRRLHHGVCLAAERKCGEFG
jgi:hypothetical protein